MEFICAQGPQFSVKKYRRVGLSWANSMGGVEKDDPHACVIKATDM
jgi:hypothetical protein